MSGHTRRGKCRLSIPVGLALVGMMVLPLSAATWIGADGSFTNGVNWDTGQVPSGGASAVIANGGTARFDGDTVAVGAFGLGNVAGSFGAFNMTAGLFSNATFRVGEGIASEGSAEQSGGSIFQLGGGHVEGAVSVGYATNSIGHYTLSGGALTANNGTFHIGSYGTGTFVQAGGTVTGRNWMVMARYPGSAGDYTMTGGVLEQVGSTLGVVVGEQGVGTFTVSQGGTVNIAGSLAISGGGAVENFEGTGVVNLCTGGTILTPIIKKNRGYSATFNFDGGVLRARGENATLDTFMQGLSAANVLAGGAIIDSGNNDVTIRQGLNDGGGGLTKWGPGSLTLAGANTYAGQTAVNEGFLAAMTPDALPGYDQNGKVTVASGAGLAVGVDGWSATEIDALLANVAFGTGCFFGFDTSLGDAVINTDLGQSFGLLKTGAHTLTLTGNNSYTGGTRIRRGILQADFGAGLPSTTAVVLDGGTLASVNAATIAADLGTGAGQISVAPNRPAGFSAVGAPLTVDLGGAGATLDWGSALFSPAPLLLNDSDADRALAFVNGLDIRGAVREIRVNAALPDAAVTLSGNIIDSIGGGGVMKTGAGFLTVSGTSTFTGPLRVNGGTLTLSSSDSNVGDIQIADGGSLIIDGSCVQQAAGKTILVGNQGSGHLAVNSGELRGTGTLSVGQNYGSSGTLILTNGTVDCRLLYVGLSGAGSIVQKGGTLRLSSLGPLPGGEWRLGVNSSGTGTYLLEDGTLDTRTANFQIGYNGSATFVQTGGTLNSGQWPVLGREVGGVGVYTLSGGVFNQTSTAHKFIVSERGNGTFTVSGTGVANLAGALWFGAGDPRGTGIVTLATGGTINTPVVYRSPNNPTPSFFTFDGGTLRASGSSATIPAFMYGLTAASIEEGGARIDSNGKTITITQSLTGYDHSPTLRHRWSFNGDLSDSAGGQTATAVGAVTTDGQQYTLKGGAKGTSYLSLGSNILPTTGPVTIEIWATQHSIQNWSRILDFGSDQVNCILMAWTKQWNAGTDRVEVRQNAVDVMVDDSMQPYTLNTEYHISLVITTDDDGKARLRWYKMDAAGTTLRSGTLSADFDLAALPQDNMWLGHSHWPDNDANASYNEVRIWNAALSEEMLKQSAKLGPDSKRGVRDGGLTKLGSGSLILAGVNDYWGATVVESGELRTGIAGALPSPTRVSLAPDSTLNLGTTAQVVAELSGNGTVSNGTLTVTGAIEPGGAATPGVLTVGPGTTLEGEVAFDAAPEGVQDRLVATGNLDLSNLTLRVRGLTTLPPRGVYVLATCAPGGLTGSFAATNLEEAPSWRINYDNERGEVRLSRSGLVLWLE
ncbi:MAG TPA: autotransporter-associated beta strand repeat-containing protein [Kiritimatiellia bacterium]|nr:autotransporter-associated beta strand repeat-containing protein [Kiritimatiellia bacterium]